MTGATTQLLRQVHPTFVQAGKVTSQAFRPTAKDEGLLSMYDGDMIAAEAAFLHYTTSLNLESVGVMGVTVQECNDEGLPSRPDTEWFKEHVVIDFTGQSANGCEKKSKKLKAKAEMRGWLYTTQFPDSVG